MLGRLEKSLLVVLRRVLSSSAVGVTASAWLMNPRVCVRAHHREQSSLRQLFELLLAAHVPRCQTSRMSCSAIGEQQEQQEATRRSRSRCTPPYG